MSGSSPKIGRDVDAQVVQLPGLQDLGQLREVAAVAKLTDWSHPHQRGRVGKAISLESCLAFKGFVLFLPLLISANRTTDF